MKLGNLFLVNAIVAVLFALGFLLIPEQVLALFAMSVSEQGIVIARLFGAALLGYALITWFARSATGEMARNLVLSLLVAFAVGSVVLVLGQLRGLANGLGWIAVAIYVLFTLGYAYFYFLKPKAQ